jgi:TP901 family phage tail tape measure protein
MANARVNVDFTADDLIRGIESANKQIRSMRQALARLGKDTSVFNKRGEQVTRTIEEWQDDFTKLTRTFRLTSKGWELITSKVDTNTKAYKKNKDAQEAARKEAERQRKVFNALSKEFAGIFPKKSSQATVQELAKVADIERKIIDLTQKAKIPLSEVRNIWGEINRGQIIPYSGKLGRLQQQLIALKGTHNKLGDSAAKTFLEQKRAADAAAAAILRQKKAAERAGRNMDELVVSWKTFARLVATQLFSQALFAFSNQVREAVGEVLKLSKAVAEIQTIDSSNTLGAEQITAELRALSEAYGVDIVEQAEAAYQTLSNQVAKGAENFIFLNDANKLAVATLSTTDEAVQILTASINAYGLNASDSAEISASLFKTIELGRTKLGELANIYGRVAVPASQLGVSFQEVNAAIATLTINGVKSTEAITFLRNIMLKFLKPTDELKEILNDAGFASGAAALQALGFGGAMELVERSTKGAVGEIAEAFGRIRAITGALNFTGEGLERYNKILNQVSTDSKSFAQAQETVLNSLGKQVDKVREELENFFEQDLAKKYLVIISELTDGFKDIPKVIKTVGGVLESILIPALAATAVAATRVALAFALTPVGRIVAVGVLAVQVGRNIRESFQQTAKDQEEAFKRGNAIAAKLLTTQQQLTDKTVSSLKKATNEYRSAYLLVLAEVNKALFETASKQETAFLELSDSLEEIYDTINEGLKDHVSEATKAFETLEKQIEKSEEKINGITSRRESGLFQIGLEDLDDTDKIDAIAARIRELQKQAGEAATTGEADRFEEIFKEIGKLNSDRNKIAKELEKENDVFFDQQTNFNKLLDKELELRKQLLAVQRTARDEAKAEKDTAQHLREQAAATITEISKFDRTKALEGSPEQVQAAFDKQIALVNKLLGIQTLRGEGNFIELIKLRENLQESSINKLQQLQQQSAEKNLTQELANIKKLAAARAAEIKEDQRVVNQKDRALLRLAEQFRTLSGEDYEDARENAFDTGRSGAVGISNATREGFFKQLPGILTGIAEGTTNVSKLAEAMKLIGTVDVSEVEQRFRFFGFRTITGDNNRTQANAIQEALFHLGAIGVTAAGTQKQRDADRNRLTAGQDQIRAAEAQIRELTKLLNIEVEKAKKEVDTATKLNNAAEALRSAAENFRKINPQAKAAGGFIPRGSDTVPAMLTPGEFVVNSRSSKKFRSQLLAINSGVSPSYFASGGSVTNVGDVKISVNSSGQTQPDIVRIGQGLHRAINQGKIRSFS